MYPVLAKIVKITLYSHVFCAFELLNSCCIHVLIHLLQKLLIDKQLKNKPGKDLKRSGKLFLKNWCEPWVWFSTTSQVHRN